MTRDGLLKVAVMLNEAALFLADESAIANLANGELPLTADPAAGFGHLLAARDVLYAMAGQLQTPFLPGRPHSESQ